MRRRVREPAAFLQAVGEIDMGVDVVGPQPQRLRIVADRLFRGALHGERISEIVVRFRKIRLERDGDPEASDRLIVAPQECEHIGQVVVHLYRTRVLPGAGAQQADRVIEPALLRAQETEIVQAIEIGGVDVQDGAIQRRGLAQSPVSVVCDGRMIVARGVVSRRCRFESVIRIGAPAPTRRPGFIQIESGQVENGHRDFSPFFLRPRLARRPQCLPRPRIEAVRSRSRATSRIGK
jgi:hypothetical protein